MHEPAPPLAEPRHLATEQFNAKLGLGFFFLYLLGYGSYMGVSAFAPQAMRQPLGGVNLALWWGFALIASAFLLALGYLLLCRTSPKAPVEVEPSSSQEQA